MVDRILTLTEELERLEQSITLTLQEIDSNFCRVHRVITVDILPLVESYAKNSASIWEGSKFWKQFFETSANVSLSGYEAADVGAATAESNMSTERGSECEQSTGQHGVLDVPADASNDQVSYDGAVEDPFKISSTTLKSSIVSTGQTQADPATKETSGGNETLSHSADGSEQFEVHKQTSSPEDPILHRVLDKTFRIQATPRPAKTLALHEPAYTSRRSGGIRAEIVSPDSPEIAVPQLRSEYFSPTSRRDDGSQLDSTPLPTRLVARGYGSANSAIAPINEQLRQYSTYHQVSALAIDPGRGVLDVDDTKDDFDLEISPPKTIQFHIPPNRLLQTPAREASRKIVDDLLVSAGFSETDEDVTICLEEDNVASPSVITNALDVAAHDF